MRVVILSSSVYSETACAMAVRLAQLGYTPVAALALRTLNASTILRKLSEWGARGVSDYARAKLTCSHNRPQPLRNPYLQPLLENANGVFRNLHEVGITHRFPVATRRNHNASDSIARLKSWNPDLLIFCGGNILRKPLLETPRLGVLNAHLAMLPEIRGMSAPEWSLLENIAVGVTIHFIDSGIDAGPILQKFELPNAASCKSLADLRNRLIAFGVEKMAEVIPPLDRRALSPTPQSDLEKDHQHFVMHQWLRSRAAERLAKSQHSTLANVTHPGASHPDMVHPC
jgi:folate-dependent phosphoribosylglycinamide formyltransferase PurN